MKEEKLGMEESLSVSTSASLPNNWRVRVGAQILLFLGFIRACFSENTGVTGLGAELTGKQFVFLGLLLVLAAWLDSSRLPVSLHSNRNGRRGLSGVLAGQYLHSNLVNHEFPGLLFCSPILC